MHGSPSYNVNQDQDMTVRCTVGSAAVAIALGTFIYKGIHGQHRAGNTPKAAGCRELRKSES